MPNKTPPTPHRHRHFAERGALNLGNRADFPYAQGSAHSLTDISKENTLRKPLTFKEVAIDYLSIPTKQNKPKSANAFKCVNAMIDVWGDKPISEIDDFDVRDFFRTLRRSPAMHRNKKGELVELKPRRPISNGTYNNYVTYYKAVFNYAMNELYEIKYVSHVKLLAENRRTKYLSPDQVLELVALIETKFPLRADLVRFAFLCGQRHEQTVHLRIDQVAADQSYIEFSQSETKNGKAQRIPLSPPAQELVRKHLAHGEYLQQRYPYLAGKIEHVFVQESKDRNVNGRPISVFLNRHVRKLMDANGFEDICFHTLRHSFASTLRTMGTDDRTIQALGGWESAQSMQQYAHIGNAELIAASNDLSKLL